MRRLVIILITALAAVLLVAAGLWLFPSNVRAVERGDVRVFLGDPNACGPVKRLWYVSSRHAVLEDMAAATAAQRPVEACVVFGRYLTAAEAEGIVGGRSVSPLELFVADPASFAGGGTVLHAGQTIGDAFAQHIREFAAGASGDPGASEDVKRALVGEWRVLAVRVAAPAAELLALTHCNDVFLVDPLYHPGAEERARSRGGVVRYICIPVRPDGRPF